MQKKFKDLKSNLTKISTERSQVNESVWESYRERALSESLDQPPFEVTTMTPEQIAKKHGVSVALINLQLKRGIEVEAEHTPHRDKAREIALDHLGERPDYYKRLAKYVEVQEEVVQEGKKKLHTPLPGSYAWRKGGLPMPKKELPYGKLKKHVEDTLKESADNLHAGHVMNFSGHTEHSFHGFSRAKQDRDAYAKHLKSQGHKVRKHSITNQLLHGMYGNVYKVSYVPKKLKEAYEVAFNESGQPKKKKPVQGAPIYNIAYPKPKGGYRPIVKESDLSEQTERERASHAERMGPPAEPEHYQVGDSVIPKEGPHAGRPHTVIHVHNTGHVNIKPNVPAKYNRYRQGAAMAHPNQLTRATLKEESSEHVYHVGDRVIPKIGPHAGQVHRVIHVHETGHVNITPDRPGKNRYHLGAARAHPSDLTPVSLMKHLEEAKQGKVKAKKKFVPDPKIWKKMPGLSKLLGVKLGEGSVISRKTVQEAFQAAKDKKKNPFAKKDGQEDAKPQKELQDNLPNDGANEPNKDNVPGDPQKEGKKSNAPAPEHKKDKTKVQGPGPDDKFQADPIVTPLTTMPDRGNGDYKRNG